MARFVAILPAGGASRRVAEHKAISKHKSKLLVPIAGGKLVLEKTLEAFKPLSYDYVMVPVPADLQDEFIPLADHFPALNLRFITGGKTRQHSVYNALKFINSIEEDSSDLYVIVHDAARCFVTTELLRTAMTEVRKHPAVSAAISLSDTIVEIAPPNCFNRCLDREMLRAVQTPQAFRFDLLYQAHTTAQEDFTDDASLVAQHSKVLYFEGSLQNKKITYAEDLDSN